MLRSFFEKFASSEELADSSKFSESEESSELAEKNRLFLRHFGPLLECFTSCDISSSSLSQKDLILVSIFTAVSLASLDEDTPQAHLFKALKERSLDNLRSAIDEGADVDHNYLFIGRPLDLAVKKNDEISLEALLIAGANPDLIAKHIVVPDHLRRIILRHSVGQ